MEKGVIWNMLQKTTDQGLAQVVWETTLNMEGELQHLCCDAMFDRTLYSSVYWVCWLCVNCIFFPLASVGVSAFALHLHKV